MRINHNYKLRELAGEAIIVNQGLAGADFTRIISLNKTARLLYEKLSDRDFTVDDAAKILSDEYGIEMQQALDDSSAWVEELKKCKIIE